VVWEAGGRKLTGLPDMTTLEDAVAADGRCADQDSCSKGVDLRGREGGLNFLSAAYFVATQPSLPFTIRIWPTLLLRPTIGAVMSISTSQL